MTLTRRTLLTAAASLAPVTAGPPPPSDLASLTIQSASDLVRRKAVSPVELTQACLARIATLNPRLNAFITVMQEQALQTAREREAEARKGKWRGPLHGIPIAIKDNIDTAGTRTTAASELFLNRIPSEDAEVVRRLRAAGAILIGKTNLHEFAYGATSAISHFGPVHNPWALDHVSGGSSGGSAAATAADLCLGSLGTDTGGSIRIPSSLCATVGFKPTYGRVSLRGIIPLSWTLDHCGPITKSVADAALLLQALAGYDALDPASVDAPIPSYAPALRADPSKLRVAILTAPFFDDLHPEVASAVQTAIGVLKKIAPRSTEVTLPPAGPLAIQVATPEIAAYHSRWMKESPARYQAYTRERLARYSAQVKMEDYVTALRQVNLLRREIAATFSTVDLLISPTEPVPALPLDDHKSFDAVGLRNTRPFNALGLPTISVPCGFTKSGLPIGLQIAGAPFAETRVITLAHAYEQATEWHKRRPAL